MSFEAEREYQNGRQQMRDQIVQHLEAVAEDFDQMAEQVVIPEPRGFGFEYNGAVTRQKMFREKAELLRGQIKFIQGLM